MATRNFHWSSVLDCVMFETDGSDVIQVTYTYEPTEFGPLVSENRSGTESYHHYDVQGSTTYLSDGMGSLTDNFLYDAWGTLITHMGTSNTSYHWIGRWGYRFEILSGTYYVRRRSFNTSSASWLSKDPLDNSHGTEVNAMYSTYVYSVNQPTRAYDPSGLFTVNSGTMPNTYQNENARCSDFETGDDFGILLRGNARFITSATERNTLAAAGVRRPINFIQLVDVGVVVKIGVNVGGPGGDVFTCNGEQYCCQYATMHYSSRFVEGLESGDANHGSFHKQFVGRLMQACQLPAMSPCCEHSYYSVTNKKVTMGTGPTTRATTLHTSETIECPNGRVIFGAGIRYPGSPGESPKPISFPSIPPSPKSYSSRVVVDEFAPSCGRQTTLVTQSGYR